MHRHKQLTDMQRSRARIKMAARLLLLAAALVIAEAFAPVRVRGPAASSAPPPPPPQQQRVSGWLPSGSDVVMSAAAAAAATSSSSSSTHGSMGSRPTAGSASASRPLKRGAKPAVANTYSESSES